MRISSILSSLLSSVIMGALAGVIVYVLLEAVERLIAGPLEMGMVGAAVLGAGMGIIFHLLRKWTGY